MTQEEEQFRAALAGRKIPILTLDHNWHKLFMQAGDNEQLHALEENVNELLRRRGKINTEIKSLNIYKKQLMQEIVALMELPESPEKDKKMDENKAKIEESNEKLEAYHDELLDLPRELSEANLELMLASMKICYERIRQNTEDIEAINQWVQDFRKQLKQKALEKQQKQIWNDEMYTYMHDIFGPEVIEMFDLKYNPKNVLNKDKNVVNNDNETPT